jgi:hypothetical protein
MTLRQNPWRGAKLSICDEAGWGYNHGMRTLRFMPLTYLAGLHGFLIFAPYVTLLVLVDHTVRYFRRRTEAVKLAAG